MQRIIHLFLAVLLWANAAQAQQNAVIAMDTGQDGRGWEAVGRLDIAGKGFCTATLIEDGLILTAAHCIYDRDNQLIAPERFTFQAGLRNGRAEATRGITKLAAHPDYDPSGSDTVVSEVAVDLAVLRLDRPIRTTRVHPFAIDSQPRAGDKIGVVSYAKDREEAPSLQEVCEVISRQTGVIIMTCDVTFGASGAPVFALRDGVSRIVSVVSAMAEVDGEKVSLGTSLAGPLQTLMAHFDTQVPAQLIGTQRVITPGQRAETGAKFVRP